MSGGAGSASDNPAWNHHLHVAGPLHDAGDVTVRPAILSAAVLVGGCFYTSGINDRPSATLSRVFPSGTPFRGDQMTIGIDAVDPDGDPMAITWSAFSCGPGGTGCDGVPYQTGTLATGAVLFDVGVDGSADTRSVRIVAHVEDSLGAPPLQEPALIVDVANQPPAITFQVGPAGPPGGPTQITARATDNDDNVADLEFIAWTISDAPFPSDGTLTFLDDNDDNPTRTSSDETYELVPDVEGTWTVSVTVADPLGTETTELQQVLIGTDHPPCIADVFPAVPPDGNTMPLDQLRRFEVLNVEDDLDIYPPPAPSDPFFGPAEFTWFLAGPASGGAYVELPGATENGFELDPAAFDPGDAVFLRVEIADRITRTLPCPPGDLSCAIDPATDPPCYQRMTWSLEVQ
jgi:hypothetical protein